MICKIGGAVLLAILFYSAGAMHFEYVVPAYEILSLDVDLQCIVDRQRYGDAVFTDCNAGRVQ